MDAAWKTWKEVSGVIYEQMMRRELKVNIYKTIIRPVLSYGAAHHHVVSATALIHRTARPSISAMSSLLGISPKCVQL